MPIKPMARFYIILIKSKQLVLGVCCLFLSIIYTNARTYKTINDVLSISARSMMMTRIADVPHVCVSKIATLLEADDLLSFTLTCKGIGVVIRNDREYIQKIRTFETCTANPYRHCFVNNTCEKKDHRTAINPLDILEEVRDLCEPDDVKVEEIHTTHISRGVFQFRIDNGKDGYYITDLHIKADFSGQRGHVWLMYGRNALRAEFSSRLMRLIPKDADGFYHLYNDFLLLVPKLVKGFNDPSDYLFLELGSSGLATIRIVRHKVNMARAHTWISRMGYNALPAKSNVLVSMPRVACDEESFRGTLSSQALYRLTFELAVGRPVAICVDIRMASTGSPIEPSLVENFSVSYVSTAWKGRKEIGKIQIDARSVHSSVVQNYKKAVKWPFFFKDCFIIPFNTTYTVDGHLHVDVKLKSAMDTISYAFYLKYYDIIHFTY